MTRAGESPLGALCFVRVEPGKYVANIFGQESYGRDPNLVYTDYIALEKGFNLVYNIAKAKNLSVAIPVGIGSGLANGDWTLIQGIIEDVFEDCNVTLYEYTEVAQKGA